MTSEKFQRQTIWESSRRPLYPKCVWVGANGTKSTGYRHIIFDHDIAKRRPANVFLVTAMAARAASNWPMACMEMHTKLHLSQRAHSFNYGATSDDDVESLKLIGSADIASYGGRSDESPKKLFDVNRRKMINHNATVCSDDDNNNNGLNRVNVRELVGALNHPTKCNQRKSIACAAAGVDSREQNQLTERVLQWLDLAGGIPIDRNDLDDIDQKRKLLLSKRRTMTATGVRERKGSMQSVTTPVNRRESIHHLSLTFNEDSANAMHKLPFEATQSSSSIPLNERALRFGEFFPTTYRCSRKFLSLRSGRAASFDSANASARTVSTPIGSTSMAGSAKKPNTKIKFQKVEQIENQYRAMIQRQILETSCNQQLAKRQLHIFMPNLPKKSAAHLLATSSAAGDECESCLSTVLSSGLSKQT